MLKEKLKGMPSGNGFVEVGDELRILRTDGSSIDLTITMQPAIRILLLKNFRSKNEARPTNCGSQQESRKGTGQTDLGQKETWAKVRWAKCTLEAKF